MSSVETSVQTAEALYAEVSEGYSRAVRVGELLERVAELAPGRVPDAEALAAERERKLPDKQGVEVAQGVFLSDVLSHPRAGAHLVWSMLRPTQGALDRLDRYVQDGELDLGFVHLRREGRVAHLEIRNQRHLNAEDDLTLEMTEVAVDVALLDPTTDVGVIRGSLVDHGKYAGTRVFSAGINLTRLYLGNIPYRFFVDRDMGYVNKLMRGLSSPGFRADGVESATTEMPWIAAVETFAIGGGCQLLHPMDHVIAERGALLSLPARKEGIIPGASNMRLPRSVGDRLARQAILSGLEFRAGTPHGDLLVDETVEPGAIDEAVVARAAALVDSGLINAVANRRAIRAGTEPLELFRRYMALYAHEAAQLYLSPALVANLERHWKAHERRI
ncbi:MAG TPA: enoyl-CoA hydratase/isomerase family protein [Solirubrobacteraceae bacterium]|nr:enoyl-CoA hydratase/isomerase family protein [Solirubrobacteraceae bacterium]